LGRVALFLGQEEQGRIDKSRYARFRPTDAKEVATVMNIQKSMIALMFVAAMGVSGNAKAANPTPLEQAEINMLTPALQAEVKSRMAAGGQKVSEILDTMLLNSVSKVFASGRVVAADFNNGVVVTQGVNGQMRAFNFDPATLVTKP
jgi:hypothetical protein